MKYHYILFLLFVFSQCSDKKSIKEKLNNTSGFVLDTTYHFIDSTKNRIFLKTYLAPDSNLLLSFKYFIKTNNKWEIINQFDSIPIPHGFSPDYSDFNGDKIKDFVFLAYEGGRGSNYFEHLFIYDSIKKSFKKIKGFEEVCAPSYDTTEKMIVGTGLSGSEQDIRTYNILKDSIVQIKGEVWEDDKLLKKYKIVGGKEIIIFEKKN